MIMFRQKNNYLISKFQHETLYIEPWGKNSLRVRSVQMGNAHDEKDWALTEAVEHNAEIRIEETSASITNGKLCAVINSAGKLTFYNQKGKVILEEYARNRKDVLSKYCSAIEVEGREFQAILGGDYSISVRFESERDEKLYGMGQYQQPYLNLKGCSLELAHRNSQASVPFLISNLGYGFLWNNPALGNVYFGKNITEWHAKSTKKIDYWITAGDTPSEIEEAYAEVTGKVPMMPEYGLGFWQCKLRYQTQEELLEVAREYKRRNLPLDVIIVDFFHWPNQGDWKFDSTYWPNPEEMIAELKSMGIELMVSVWPTVEKNSENFDQMHQQGLLVNTDRGINVSMDFLAPTLFMDPTNPETREFVWDKINHNYYSKGIKAFWLDEAEPEYTIYDFDNYRYYEGPNVSIGNLFPLMYAKTFFDGMTSNGQKDIVNLLRCAWAGSQKYGALVWSGDIASSYISMRNQLAAGLNMGIAGIPWWTTDIGGFHGGNPDDEEFRELFIRWFQWGTFCPVMRLHGDREPHQPQVGTTGGAKCLSGAPNEVWSYGEAAYEICKKYMNIREDLREYVRAAMLQAHEKGTPVMKPLFYQFPEDTIAWEIEDQYIFGDSLLVAPILYAGLKKRNVYLPSGGSWREFEGKAIYEGGQFIEVDAPIDIIPVFELIK